MKSLVVFLLFTSLTGYANANVTIYTNETAFVNASGISSFDSYEDLPVSPSEPGFERPGYNIGIDSNTVGRFEVQFSNNAAPPSFPDGSTRISFNSDNPHGGIYFHFAYPIYAFGLYLIDAPEDSDNEGNYDLIFSNDIGDNIVVISGPVTNESAVFFGVVSNEPMQEVKFQLPGASDGLALDKFYFSQPSISVPAMPVLGSVLLGIALTWLALVRLRQLKRIQKG